VTRDQIIAVAKATAEWEGWRWSEPVAASRRKPLFSRRPVWHVRLEDNPGACVDLTIDDATGQVVKVELRRP